MSQAAEQLLNDVLLKYGSASCDTPNMLEMLLRKYGRACPKEVEIMSAALRCGVVSQLRSERGMDPISLARMMVMNAHVPQAKADWAVGAWSAAIANAPANAATPIGADDPPAPSAFSAFRVFLVLGMAAAIGAITYLIFGR